MMYMTDINRSSIRVYDNRTVVTLCMVSVVTYRAHRSGSTHGGTDVEDRRPVRSPVFAGLCSALQR